MIQPSCDRALPVTPRSPGQHCDNPLAVTTLRKIQAQERPHWFTCTFPGAEKRIAIVRVYGAQDQEQARAAVQSCWQKCQYTVTDGDETNGHAQPFTLALKRNIDSLRFTQERGEEVQGCSRTY